MAQRTGLRTIRDVAHKLCLLVAAFAPVIRKAYPENAALQLALDAAIAACGLLVVAADDALGVGD
jgi:hypothetical protein